LIGKLCKLLPFVFIEALYATRNFKLYGTSYQFAAFNAVETSGIPSYSPAGSLAFWAERFDALCKTASDLNDVFLP
jgi:hypothetical protein